MKAIQLFPHPKLPSLLNVIFFIIFLVIAATLISCEDSLVDDQGKRNGGKISTVVAGEPGK